MLDILFLTSALIFPTLAYGSTYQQAPANIRHPYIVDVLKPPLSQLSSQEKLAKWKMLWRDFPESPTWDNYISAFNDENCLTVLDNFANVNLGQNMLPIITRQPKHVMMEKAVVWSLPRIQENSTALFPQPAGECLSKYFVLVPSNNNIHDICLRLNIAIFVIHSKPWRCLVKLDIFPPLEVFEGASRVPAFAQYHFKESRFMQFTTPSLYLIVKPGNSMALTRSMLGAWIGKNFHRVLQSKLFGVISLSRIDWRFHHSANAASFALIKFCPSCSTADENLVTVHLPSHVFGEIMNKSILTLAAGYPANEDTLEVAFEQAENNILFDHVTMHIAECQKAVLYSTSRVSTNMDHALENVGRGLAKVWDSIFKNYSVLTTSFWRSRMESCKNKNKIKISSSRDNFQMTLRGASYPKGYYYPLHRISDPSETLRFISCGKSGDNKALPFSELLVPFDSTTWLVMIISLVALMIASSLKNGDANDCTGDLFSFVKVILEQGDPFPNKLLASQKSKVATITFMIMSIVLSNGYKNTNLYNMILPRTPIPLEYFKELVENNFTVYTGSTSIDQYYTFLKVRNIRPCIGLKLPLLELDLEYCINTMVGSFEEIVEKFYVYQQSLEDDKDKIEMLHTIDQHARNLSISKLGVLTRAKLHPDFLNYLLSRNRSHAELEIGSEMHLYEALRSCDKTALVLPEHRCKHYARKLGRENDVSEVNIGKEVYSDFSWFFDLTGIIPPHATKHIKTVGESGIWDWSMKIGVPGGPFHDIKQEIPPKATSMGGNIVIIFTLWMVGLFISSVFILMEVGSVILGSIRLWLHPNFYATKRNISNIK